MVRPGVNVISRAAPPPRGAPSDTGVAFIAGLTAKGPTDGAYLVRNMTDFVRIFGDRVSYGLVYDALDVFFHEGGVKAYVSRVVGPGAAVDTHTFQDAGAANSIAVDSIGGYDSNITVQVVAGSVAGTFVLVVFDNAIEVERSYDLLDVAAAVTWGTSSNYVRVRALGANDPAVVAAQALTGGTDDRGNVTDTQRTAALDRFIAALGPGQVLYPGATTEAMYEALLTHAQTKNRVALLDAADTASNTTLVAAADGIRASATLPADAEQWGALFAPWVVVPGVTAGTTRTVPPSALVAGLIARSDATNNPNTPAAGSNGEARYAVGISQAEWTDAVRQVLNDNTVNVLRMVYGAVRLYGYRSISEFPTDPWSSFAAARLRMAIVNGASEIGESFMFDQIDGKGRKVAEFNGALVGLLSGYYTAGALFGETADEAFGVETGAAVNTPTTLAANELHAVLSIRTSPFAEMVQIEIVKVPITDVL